MKINMQKIVQVEAKTLSLCLKVRDQFTAELKDQDGVVLKQYEDYVPGFMPGAHGGDYVELDIDLDTGMIRNWQTPSVKDIEEFLAGNEP